MPKRRRATRGKNTLRKLSPQLNALLSLGLPAVRKLAVAARANRQTQGAKIEERSRQAVDEENPDRRQDIEREVDELIEAIPHSLVHGVYFPTEDGLEDDAPIALDEPYVSALIKSQCAYVDLERLGLRVRQQAHDIFSVFVPWKLLKGLAQMPGIDFIELARPMRRALNVSLPYSQITNLKTGGLNGAGVIVGVVDSSFLFFYHPDFRNPRDGSTRVLFIWDQALEAQGSESAPSGISGFTPGGNGATYGVEYSKPNIDAELTNFLTPQAGQLPAVLAYQTVRHQTGIAGSNTAHGTHVCGIAAGNGRAPPPASASGSFAGAAPNASIIYVCNIAKNTWHADSTTVTDAFAYIFARAALLNKPCVVNMSQGDNVGPHDGTSLVEQFLDNLLLQPGRAITLAAGNTTAASQHTSGSVLPAGTANVTLNFSSNAGNDESAEIWYDGHDVFGVTLRLPNGLVIGPIAPGASSPVVTLGNGIKVQVVHTQNDPRNGDNVISLFITNVAATRPIPNGAWTFGLTATSVINGTFEAWVDVNNTGKHAWGAATSTRGTIQLPASGERVIGVGAHDRTSPLPIIYYKSGVGPTRDDRIKPDITAVGVSVTSTWLQLINTKTPGPFYKTIGGTSMAAPMVAGTAALLFQCRGASLTSSDVKQLLQNTAGMPADGVPSNPFGWGFLQAANLCAAPFPDVDVWLRDHASDNGVEPFTGPISWLSPDIEVLDLAGNLVSNPTHDPTNFINNLVRVTVQNRGTQTARNVEVYLYWSDPATYIPFPGQWRATRIYTSNPKGFVVQSNKIVVPQLAAGASDHVEFGWAPPPPGTNILGDDHFCLIARLEHEGDASNLSTGGWSQVEGSNNIACLNTHVQQLTAGIASTGFYVTGSGDHDALEIETDKLGSTIELIFPVQALPWRDLGLINRTGKRHSFGGDAGDDPLAGEKRVVKEKEATLRTGIEGLTELRLADGNAHLIAPAANTVVIPEIRVQAGVRMPVRMIVRAAKIGDPSSFVHVRHRSGGKIIGGVTLELTRELKRAKRMVALLEGDELAIRPR